MGVGVGLQAIGVLAGFAAAQQQAKAYKLQQQQYKEQAEMAKIQADQQEEQRSDQLKRTLAALGVSGSARGVSVGVGSQSALAADEKKIANKDIASIKLMGSANRRKFELSATSAGAGAKAATLGGIGGAATGIYKIQNPSYTKTSIG